MGVAKMDAEDLKLELDKMDEAQQGKETTIDQAKVEADIAALRELAGAGKRQEAVEGLLALEKAGRVAEDITSTRKACSAILEVLAQAQDWKGVQEYVTLLSKRRGQLKQAVQAMVRQAMGYLAQAPSETAREEMIRALLAITEGKIYVEIERARLTRQLARMKEAAGQMQEAAEILQEVPVETFGAMAKTEKIAYILEQVRLCLERKDYVRAHILSKKVSPRAFASLEEGAVAKKGEAAGEIGIEGTAIEEPEEGTPSLEALKLQYYGQMVRYWLHQGDYLEVARAYKSIYDTPSVQEDPALWPDVLKKVCWYLVLAPVDSHQASLLALTAGDKRVDGELPAYRRLLQQFRGSEVLWWRHVSKEYESEMGAQAEVFGGEHGERAAADFKLRVVEHNISVVAKYYRQISLARLAQLLDLSPGDAERHLADMVVSKKVSAKVDRPAGVVRFATPAAPSAALNAWSASISKLLDTVEKTCQQIQKESMVHKVPIGVQG